MSSSMHWFQMILWIFIQSSLVKQTTGWRKIHKYGPKICEVLCKQQGRCSSPILDAVQLVCHPRVNNSTSHPGCHTKRKNDCPGVHNNKQHTTGNNIKKFKKPGIGIWPSCSPTDVSTFHEACSESDLKVVQRYVCQDLVNINCRGEENQTAVMLAAWKADDDIFDFLLQQEADVSLVDADNYNVLDYACRGGSTHIVKILLDDYHFDVEKSDDFDSTPLFHAAYIGNIAVVKLLKDRGANIQRVDDGNINILHKASTGGVVDMVRYVLALNLFDIDCKDVDGQTPVMFAIMYCHRPVVDLLRDEGADMRIVDYDNNTMLHMACHCGDVDMVKYFLSLNIYNLESRGEEKKTPLMVAVIEGNIQVVKFLMHKGADAKTVCVDNSNILHQASNEGNFNMLKYILSYNICEIESRSINGQTPLMYAVCKGHIEVADMLIKRGADIRTVDNTDSTILHKACSCGVIEMVKYVLSLNIFGLELRDNNGATPMLHAAREGHTSVLEFLRMRGANETVVDNNGRNVVHLASEGGWSHMLRYLMNQKTLRGFERKKDTHGLTAIDIAMENDDQFFLANLNHLTSG